MNFHLHRRICLSGTLITASAVASLQEAKGNQHYCISGHRLTSVRVVEKRANGVKGVLPSEVRMTKSGAGVYGER